MPLYVFTAYNFNGRKTSGQRQAKSMDDLEKELEKIGFILISAHPKIERRRRSISQGFEDWGDDAERLLKKILPKKLIERPRYDPEAFRAARKEREEQRAQIAKGDTDRMPTYHYVAKTDAGGTIRGEMEALNREDLARRLDVMGIRLIRANGAEPDKKIKIWFLRRIGMRDLYELTQQMQEYFTLGLTVVEILDAMRISSGSKRMKALLYGIRMEAAKGIGFTEALKPYRRAFPRFFLSVVEVGELTGSFTAVFRYASRHLKWLLEFRREVIRKLRWPTFTWLFVSGIPVWLPWYLVHFLFYGDFTLSPSSRSFMEWVVNPVVLYGWPIIFGVPLFLIYAIPLLRRLSSRFDLLFDQMLLKIPLLSNVLTAFDTAQFAYLFGLMWNAGLNAEESLKRAAKVMSNAELREAVGDIELLVHNGETLSNAFSRSGIFPLFVAGSFSVGEKTGSFQPALDEIYHFYTRQIEDAVDALVAVLYHAIYITAGCMVLGLAGYFYSK